MNSTDKRLLPKTQEVIQKISETKREIGRQEILENTDACTQKQSNIQLAIPSHRKHKHISLEEYKNLIKEGKTVLDITKITSKHLVYFYNALIKGRINLDKEEFVKLYEEGISLDEISKKHNIPREYISQLREFYGIKRKGAKYIKRITNEQPLSQEAKDIIIGSMLGDGHIASGGYYSEKHSEKQIGYLEWKGSFLTDILTDKSYYFNDYYDKRYDKINYSFCLRTCTHSFIYELSDKFYTEISGKRIKIIPNNIEELINDKVLAIWFMDDGNTDWTYRNNIKEYKDALPQSKISSESFTLQDNIKLSQTLSKKYGLITNIRFRTKDTKPYLRFDCPSSIKLFEIIKPFVCQELMYKIDEQEYLIHKNKIFDRDALKEKFFKDHNIK